MRLPDSEHLDLSREEMQRCHRCPSMHDTRSQRLKQLNYIQPVLFKKKLLLTFVLFPLWRAKMSSMRKVLWGLCVFLTSFCFHKTLQLSRVYGLWLIRLLSRVSVCWSFCLGALVEYGLTQIVRSLVWLSLRPTDPPCVSPHRVPVLTILRSLYWST